jgi:hypothetical protein
MFAALFGRVLAMTASVQHDLKLFVRICSFSNLAKILLDRAFLNLNKPAGPLNRNVSGVAGDDFIISD